MLKGGGCVERGGEDLPDPVFACLRSNSCFFVDVFVADEIDLVRSTGLLMLVGGGYFFVVGHAGS